MVEENCQNSLVAFQTPCPSWVQGEKYDEQPRFIDRVGYMTEMQADGLTVMSGPSMEKAGGLTGVSQDGGMTISKAADFVEATHIAKNDPTVKLGLLNCVERMLGVVSRMAKSRWPPDIFPTLPVAAAGAKRACASAV